MPQFAVEFHPLAADEAEAAERWYHERNEIAAGRFRRELNRAIERIAERPEAGSPYLSRQGRTAAPLSVFRRVSRPRREHSDRRRCAGAAEAGILASR